MIQVTDALVKLIHSLEINCVSEDAIRELINTLNQFPYNINKSFWMGTKAEYLSLDEWDDNTIYFIKEVQTEDAAIEVKED